MIKLYDYPRCPYCRKVRIALAEKGIEYKRINVDLIRREQKSEEFLKINPYGKVPVLVDNGFTVYESSVINEYIEERYPHSPLMPPTPAERARARILVDFCETRFHPSWFNVYMEIVLKEESNRDEDLINRSYDELDRHMYRLNEELEGREYLAGKYSLADIAFTPRLALFDQLGIEIPAEFTNVAEWMERIKRRPSYHVLDL